MTRITLAKFAFCFAALVFAAKPFVGFSLSHHLKSTAKTNIIAKIFSKRKIEDVHSSMNAFKKQLADPNFRSIMLFFCLLSLLFPLAFKDGDVISAAFLNRQRLSLQPQPVILLTGQLLI
jgi:hypothetical protein